MKKYNIDEQHIFICSNCGNEFLYKLPKILIEQMNRVSIQTIRKECRNVINTWMPQGKFNGDLPLYNQNH